MLKNYFMVLSRNLWRNKFSAILNMLGLAVGMTCYLLIVQYVNFELSYDGFHEHKNNIYRLQRDDYEDNGVVNRYALTSYNVGPALKDEFPEVKEVSRCLRFENNTITCGEHKFRNEKIYVTEPSFFKLFSFRLLRGDQKTALQGPNKVILSETTASKYFGKENPLGQMIQIASTRNELSCMVTGVFEDVPGNSHMKFELLVSLDTLFPANYSDWIFSTVYTHLLLNPGANPQALEAKLPPFIKKYIIKDVPRAVNWIYRLQPLKDIYLYSDLTYDTENGNGKMVYFLLIIALLILVISWINYVNLSTARAMDRAREVGTRKVLGSHRFQLIKQFLSESVLVNILPIVVSVILAALCLPFLKDLTGKNIPLYLGNLWFLGHLLILYISGSLLSGLYPAFVLSAFPPITVLGRSKFSQTTSGILLRKVLVTFQFAASAVLIILTFTVYRQIQYMTNRDLGINIDRILGITLPTMPLNQYNTKNINNLKTELLRYPDIESVSGSLLIPGSAPQFQRLTWKENTDFKNGKILSIVFVDYDFLPTYRIKFLFGRNFAEQYGTDTTAAVLNEAAVKSLGYEKTEAALDQNISIWQIPGNFRIIGIIGNYHHQSLKKSHDPIVFLLNPLYKNYYSIRLKPSITRMDETLSLIKNKWDEIFPGYPFDYFFLADHFNQQYQADYQFGRVLGIFVVLAIFITCLGLLGLSYFNTYQRRKEIGIRKSFGASSGDIVLLLTKNTVKLVALAAVIAWPIAFFIIDNWLKNYANRISMPWLFFILSGIILTLLSILTVAYHSFAAARANPVDSLREE